MSLGLALALLVAQAEASAARTRRRSAGAADAAGGARSCPRSGERAKLRRAFSSGSGSGEAPPGPRCGRGATRGGVRRLDAARAALRHAVGRPRARAGLPLRLRALRPRPSRACRRPASDLRGSSDRGPLRLLGHPDDRAASRPGSPIRGGGEVSASGTSRPSSRPFAPATPHRPTTAPRGGGAGRRAPGTPRRVGIELGYSCLFPQPTFTTADGRALHVFGDRPPVACGSLMRSEQDGPSLRDASS